MPDSCRTAMLNRKIILQLAASISLLLLLSAFLPDFPVWITDNGNKYIVTENISTYQTGVIQHPCPEFFPSGGFHFVKTANGFRSFYLEYLAYLSVLPKKIFGVRGLLFWPFISTCLLIGLLLKKFYRHSQIGWFTVFASPIVFYTLLYWESTPAVLLTTVSGMILWKKRPLSAGMILGSGLIFREELYMVFASVFLALLINRKKKETLRYAAGFLIPAIMLWLKQYMEFGHILGLHGGNYRSNNNVSSFSLCSEALGILWNYYHHLLRFDAAGGIWDYLLIPVFAGMLLCGSMRKPSSLLLWKKTILIAGTFILAVLTFALFQRHDLAYAAALTTGLLPSTPLIWGLLINWRPMLCQGKLRLFIHISFLYLLLVPPLLTRNDIGLIWGGRHFLYIMPALFILSWLSLKQAKMTKLFFVLAGSGILLQSFGYYALYQVSHEADELQNQLLSQPGKVIVNDIFFIPEETPEVFFKKTILDVNENNLSKLPEALRKLGENSFTLLLSAQPQFRKLSNASLAKLLEMYPPASEPLRWKREIGSGFIDLFIVRCGNSPK